MWKHPSFFVFKIFKRVIIIVNDLDESKRSEF